MIKEIDVTIEPLTRSLAEEISKLPGARGERTLKKKRLEKLANILKDDRFDTPDWAVCFFEDQKYRINGQHSSTVLVNSNEKFPENKKVIMRVYRCDSTQDMADLFSRFDQHFSIRNLYENLIAHARSEPSLNDIAPTNIKIATSGIAGYHEINGEGRVEPEDRFRTTHSHQDFIKFFNVLHPSKACSLKPVVGAIYASWLIDRSKAFEFWNLVAQENHPDNMHPSRVIAKFINNTRLQSAGEMRGKISSKRAYTYEAIYERCALAWNAYRDGRTTQTFKPVKRKDGQITQFK